MVESAGWTSGVLAGTWAQDCTQVETRGGAGQHLLGCLPGGRGEAHALCSLSCLAFGQRPPGAPSLLPAVLASPS